MPVDSGYEELLIYNCDTAMKKRVVYNEDYPLLYLYARGMLFLALGHIALDVKACHFRNAVCAHRDGLFKVPGELSGTRICNLYLAFLPGSDRRFGIRRHRTSA